MVCGKSCKYTSVYHGQFLHGGWFSATLLKFLKVLQSWYIHQLHIMIRLLSWCGHSSCDPPVPLCSHTCFYKSRRQSGSPSCVFLSCFLYTFQHVPWSPGWRWSQSPAWGRTCRSLPLASMCWQKSMHCLARAALSPMVGADIFSYFWKLVFFWSSMKIAACTLAPFDTGWLGRFSLLFIGSFTPYVVLE